MRQVASVGLRGLAPAAVKPELPTFDWVDPRSLVIEDQYQRDLSSKSITMIRGIVENWSWANVKPAVCVRHGNHLVVIDGQHTAIAAVTHGGIERIPVMIVDAPTVKERAAAFISQNRNRLALTPMHMHFAALAAGDEVAVAIDEACRKAGARIIRASPGKGGTYKVGDTFAVGIIGKIVAKIGAHQGARVLKVLVEAKRAPLVAHEIAAVRDLLFDQKYRESFEANGATYDLATVIRSRSTNDWLASAAKLMATNGATRRTATAAAIHRAMQKVNRNA